MAVQISGNDITVPRDGTFTRNVTIGGTLTYEDVTNVDSVGLITARNGIIINSGGVNVGGALTVTTSHSQVGIFTANSNGANIRLFDDDTESKIRTVDGRLQLHADDGDAIADSQIRFMIDNDTKGFISAGSSFSLGNDADTYISRADANTLAVTTGGSERARITSSGKVGIGTDEPIGLLHLTAQNSDCELILESDTDNDDEYDNPRIIFRQDGHASQSSIGIGGTTDDSSMHNCLTLRNSVSTDGGIIFMTNNVNGSLTPYQQHLEAVERLRIAGTGAFGLSGTNYGSDNQALTSKGSSSPPEWRGINAPAWDADQTTANNVATSTWTLVSGLAENVDTAGAFTGSTFTVPAGGAGTYFIYGVATIDDIQADDFVLSGIVVNAASNGNDPINSRRGGFGCSGGANERVSSYVNIITTLAVGDEVRLAVYHNEGSTEPTEPYYTRFGGYRLSV